MLMELYLFQKILKLCSPLMYKAYLIHGNFTGVFLRFAENCEKRKLGDLHVRIGWEKVSDGTIDREALITTNHTANQVE